MNESNNLFSLLNMQEGAETRDIDIKKLQLQVVDNSFAKQFMSTHHYSQTSPNLYYALGFYYEGDLACMVSFGPPSGRLLAQAIMEDGTAQNVCELVRLFAFDWSPKNTESFCIGQSLKWIEANCPDMQVVVSYADPNQGHMGTIYQATNWLYTGQGSRIVDSYEFFIDGHWVHPRSIFATYGTTSTAEVSEKLGYEVETRVCQHKYRYIYLLGDKRQRRAIRKKLKVESLPYPKAGGD